MSANVILKQILLKRGNSSVSSTYVGPLGEITLDTTLKTIRIHDGITPGGNLIAQGAQGPAGPAGAPGGPPGPQGNIGSTGATGLHVTKANVTVGNLLITLSNSQVINAGLVTGATGPIGLQGNVGSTGATGPAANIAIYDEGNLVIGAVASINFVGAIVTANNAGANVTVTIVGNNVPLSSDRLVSGNAQVVLNTSGPEPYVLFPAASTGGQLQISEAEISSISGNLALTSAQGALIIANGDGSVPGGSRLWRFDRTGSITLPNNAVIKDTVTNSISFGLRAGDSGQGTLTVAIGSQAGEINQGLQSTAVGSGAGNYNQGIGTVAIGTNAGAFNQGLRAVAIGGLAGSQNQGEYAVALGNFAGGTNQPNNSIIINATGTALNGSASGLFIDPIREDTGNIAKVVYYNISTKELTYADLGAAATVDITNTNGLTTTYYPTFVENRTSGQTIRADVDLTYRTDTNLLTSGNIQVGRNIYGSPLGGISDAIQLRPNISIDKRFLFTVDSISGTYIRSSMEMPVAEVNKVVTLGFPHANGTVSYIFNQGTDTNGTEWNDALVIFQNGGNVKIGTITSGNGTKIWEFNQTGHITLPNGAVIKDSATDSIAFGGGAGATSQGHSAVSLGEGAGNNAQGNQAVAVGRGSGNDFQGNGAIGIGFCAGATNQGDYAIAIGFKAARGNMDNDGTPNQPANSIMINASSTPLNGNQAGLYINPIREDTGNIAKVIYYNISTKELTYADPAGGGGAGLPLVNGTSNFDIATENGNATITVNGTSWTFDTDGLLQVPDYTGNIGGIIGDNYADGGLTIKANSTLTGYVELTNNDETAGVYVQNDATAGQVRIYTANGDWNFNADGSLTLNGGGVSLGNGSLTGVKGIDRRASFNTLTAGVMTISNNERNAYIGNPTGNEITSNFTVNLTNFVLEAYYETSVKIKISQHTTGYYPNVLQINGVTQTIRWEGGSSPTPGSNTVDLVEFDIQNTNSGGGAYLVLGRFVGGKNTGNLTFPDGTIQSTAYTGGGAAGTVDITNTNGLTTTYYPTFVESRTNGQYMRADVDLTYRTDTNTLTAGNMATGVLKIEDGVHEKFQTKSNATGTVTHDCSSGHIFYHTLPNANWTVNLTNLNLAVGYATAITLVIEQGATGYYPSAVQIDGNAVPLAWQGNIIPTPSSNRFDVVTFSILYDGLYTVLGQLTGF